MTIQIISYDNEYCQCGEYSNIIGTGKTLEEAIAYGVNNIIDNTADEYYTHKKETEKCLREEIQNCDIQVREI